MIKKNWYSTRPRTDAERARCVEFVGDLDPATLTPKVTGSFAEFGPVDTAFEAARAANEAADKKVDKASERVRTGSALFKVAFLKWTVAIDDAHEKGYALAALKPELGGKPPSLFLEETDWEKVARMAEVSASVDADPTLVGRPAVYKALEDATDHLRDALGAHDRALTARSTAVKALTAATGAFDRAWGKLVHDLKYYDSDGLGATVPRFRRTRSEDDVAAAEPTPAADLPDDPSG